MTKNFIIFFLLFNVVTISFSYVKINRSSTKHKLLLISFDGLRWDYASRRPDLTSFKYLEENGVKAEYMKAAMPTQTSPNHMSIATGQYVESHGVTHNCDYNISTGYKPSSFFTALTNNDWWDNGAEPIWITAVNQGLKSGGILFPGTNSTYDGVSITESILDEQGLPNDEGAWTGYVDLTMEWLVDRDYDMIALYFNEPDKTSHKKGPNDKGIAETMMPKVDRTINYLLDSIKENNLEETLNVIITSDHGFDTIDKSVKRNDPDAISLSTYVDQDLIDFQFAYGPLALIQAKPGHEREVADALRAGNSISMDVYLKEEIPERYHYRNNDRITNIVVFAKPGYSCYSFFTGFHPNTGEHGYDNGLENMRASYYSFGPSFKKGYKQEGFENVNIYPLMCHLLGLQPHPNNGSLDVLKHTLLEFDEKESNSDVTKPLNAIYVIIASVYFLINSY